MKTTKKKKTTRRKRSLNGVDSLSVPVRGFNYKRVAMNAAGVIVGVIAGAQLKSLLTSKNASGETPLQGLGLGDMASNIAVPIVIAGAGLVANGLVKDDFLKSAALGLTAAGGAGLLNEATGKQVVYLGGTQGVHGVGDAGVTTVQPVSAGRVLIPRQVPPKTSVRGVQEANLLNGSDADEVMNATAKNNGY